MSVVHNNIIRCRQYLHFQFPSLVYIDMIVSLIDYFSGVYIERSRRGEKAIRKQSFGVWRPCGIERIHLELRLIRLR